MNTTDLKSYAPQARQDFIAAVALILVKYWRE